MFPGYTVEKVISKLRAGFDYNLDFDENVDVRVKEFARVFYSNWNAGLMDCIDCAYEHRIQPQSLAWLFSSLIASCYRCKENERLKSL